MSTLAQPDLPYAIDSEPVSAARAPVAVAAVKKPKAKLVLGGLIAAALVGFGGTTIAGLGKETTDDAFVEGHVSNVAPRVVGLVKKVLVADNAQVAAGDVLVELDDRDFLVKVASAKADLAAARAAARSAETLLALTRKNAESNLVVAKGGVTQASAMTNTTQATVAQSQADVIAAESRRKLAQTEMDRSERLIKQGVISAAELDIRRSTIEQADAALVQARARLGQAQANIANAFGTNEAARGKLIAADTAQEQIEAATAQVELTKARGDQAQAALDQAELNLSYTKVKAESAGVVSRRTVEVGQQVSPDRPLLAVVPLDGTWVVANFKEDQIAKMKMGQKVEVEIDTFGRKKIEGTIDSLAAGTGSRFTLLPPDNASGNFTKVVQRVPVLVRLEGHPDLTLRPGMSASVTVNTR